LRKNPSTDTMCQCKPHHDHYNDCKHCSDGYLEIGNLGFIAFIVGCVVICCTITMIIVIYCYIRNTIIDIEQARINVQPAHLPVLPIRRPQIQRPQIQRPQIQPRVPNDEVDNDGEHIEVKIIDPIRRTIELNQECSVCRDAKANVLTTCRHVVMCESCYYTIINGSREPKCPICNQRIYGGDSIIVR
jgi:hypothetical protein